MRTLLPFRSSPRGGRSSIGATVRGARLAPGQPMGFGPELLIWTRVYSTPLNLVRGSSLDGGVVRGLWHRFQRSGKWRSRMLPEKAGSRGLFSMEANPWAVVIFVGILLGLHGLGVDSTKPPIFGALFLGFVPVWILCGMLWDRVTIGRADRRCATPVGDDRV